MRHFVLTPTLVSVLLIASIWNTGCNRERVTEARQITLPLTNGQLNVTGKNGGIEVTGEDRNDIDLEARVTAYAPTKDEAEEIERQVRIMTDGTIRAEGPRSSGWFSGGYSVDYRLHVPSHLSAELHTVNGGIEIRNIEGALHAETTNGHLMLDDVAGDVDARTVNGGIDAKLTGSGWSGDGLSVKTVNGGISVTVPDHYSAHLVARTVNGGVSVEMPGIVQGDSKHHLDTNLGQGGATLRLENGQRRSVYFQIAADSGIC